MRKIKFRGLAFDKSAPEWVYGDLVKVGNGHVIITSSECSETLPEDWDISLGYTDKEFKIVNSNSVGQFTGLYDKNGKEVYEGDVIRWYAIDYDIEEYAIPERVVELTGTVEYRNGSYEVRWTDPQAMSRHRHDNDLEELGLSKDNEDYFLIEECYNITEEEKRSDEFYGIEVIGNVFDDIEEKRK